MAVDVALRLGRTSAWRPWLFTVLQTAGSREGLVRGGCKSVNDQGRGTQWSVGREGGLVYGSGGLWRDHGRETLGSRPPTETDVGAVGRRPSRPGTERPEGVSAGKR